MEGLSKAHSNSEKYKKQKQLLQNQQKSFSEEAIENCNRSGIVVQTNRAGIHYEIRIAKLYQGRAEVVDFGHSRMIYSQLIDIACYFNSSFEETFTQYRSPPFR